MFGASPRLGEPRLSGPPDSLRRVHLRSGRETLCDDGRSRSCRRPNWGGSLLYSALIAPAWLAHTLSTTLDLVKVIKRDAGLRDRDPPLSLRVVSPWWALLRPPSFAPDGHRSLGDTRSQQLLARKCRLRMSPIRRRGRARHGQSRRSSSAFAHTGIQPATPSPQLRHPPGASLAVRLRRPLRGLFHR
jgi:hypothetical protein